ncbi:MAG: hypothetical protein RR330_07660, partial [Alistipes sp.]
RFRKPVFYPLNYKGLRLIDTLDREALHLDKKAVRSVDRTAKILFFSIFRNSFLEMEANAE